MDLSKTYAELVLEESRNPRNRHELEGSIHAEPGHNPSCGDEIILRLKVKDGTIKDAAFTGKGCATSQASTSIMCDTIRGKKVEEGRELAQNFIGMINGSATEREELKKLGDVRASESTKNPPARVKCAVLPWYTLDQTFKEKEK